MEPTLPPRFCSVWLVMHRSLDKDVGGRADQRREIQGRSGEGDPWEIQEEIQGRSRAYQGREIHGRSRAYQGREIHGRSRVYQGREIQGRPRRDAGEIQEDAR